MANPINRGSGSLFPDKKILDEQLNPQKHTKPERYKEIAVHSEMLGKDVSLYSGTVNDLPRQGTFIANDKVIYDNSSEMYYEGWHNTEDINTSEITSKNISKNTSKDTSEKVENLFDEIVMHSGTEHAEGVAVGYANLEQQAFPQAVIKEVLSAKGMYKEGELTDYTISTKRKVSVVNTDEKKATAQYAQETLYAVSHMQDIEKQSFFKVKAVVSGKAKDLAQRNISELDFTVAYTKEYPTLEAAEKSNYFGTRAAMSIGSKSYLTPKPETKA